MLRSQIGFVRRSSSRASRLQAKLSHFAKALRLRLQQRGRFRDGRLRRTDGETRTADGSASRISCATRLKAKWLRRRNGFVRRLPFLSGRTPATLEIPWSRFAVMRPNPQKFRNRPMEMSRVRPMITQPPIPASTRGRERRDLRLLPQREINLLPCPLAALGPRILPYLHEIRQIASRLGRDVLELRSFIPVEKAFDSAHGIIVPASLRLDACDQAFPFLDHPGAAGGVLAQLVEQRGGIVGFIEFGDQGFDLIDPFILKAIDRFPRLLADDRRVLLGERLQFAPLQAASRTKESSAWPSGRNSSRQRSIEASSLSSIRFVTMPLSARKPCRSAFLRERALPSSVFGPVDFSQFRRFA